MHPEPALPNPRGPLSDSVTAALRGRPEPIHVLAGPEGDPLSDEDLHLALYVLYELHYRSFLGVDPGWEWEPSLIALRRSLEKPFFGALRDVVPASDVEPGAVGDHLFERARRDDGPSLSEHLRVAGTLAQMREYLVHRSPYQLKEADPHTWAIPRLFGGPKAALVEVQFDEYGSGDPERIHAVLFARAMAALGLDPAYGAYLDRVPGTTLAMVNLISLLGLDRSLRGALVGHLAMFEITSSVPNGRYAAGLRRLGLSGDALDFFDEHVEADSVHENIAAYDLAQGLALQQPELTADILFGAEALLETERRFAAGILEAWDQGASSLRPEREGYGEPEPLTTVAGDGSETGALSALKAASL